MSKDSLGLKGKVRENELDISMMGLKEVPMMELKMFSHRLKNLDLSNNHVQDLGLDFATNFPQLTFLDLSKNVLTRLPENIGLLVNLVHFDLYRNRIERLPLSMSGMVKLRWMDIKDNPLVPTLGKVCGTCSNQAECRTCARNVILFMKHLDKQISAMDASECDDLTDAELDVQSQAALTLSQARLRNPSKVISAPIREVLSPPRDNSGSDSETDKGSGDEETQSLVTIPSKTKSGILGQIPRTSNQPAVRRHRKQPSNHSNTIVADESAATPAAPVNSKNGGQTKKKSISSHSYTVHRKPEDPTLMERMAKGVHSCYVNWRPVLTGGVRMLLFMNCLYVSLFTLLAIVYDEKSMRYFLEDVIQFQGLSSCVVPMHAFFQRAVQFGGVGPHYIPMVRMETDSDIGTMTRFFNFLTGSS